MNPKIVAAMQAKKEEEVVEHHLPPPVDLLESPTKMPIKLLPLLAYPRLRKMALLVPQPLILVLQGLPITLLSAGTVVLLAVLLAIKLDQDPRRLADLDQMRLNPVQMLYQGIQLWIPPILKHWSQYS
jgi:hypothetical protein